MKTRRRRSEIVSIFTAYINKATATFIIVAFVLVGNVNAYTYNGTTHTVTNSADSGPGTLRDILGTVNDGDIIDFDPGVTYITLTSGRLNINDSIHIKGPGPANLTIDGNANDRGFYMAQGGVTSIISGITITNCAITGSSKGGGIYIGTPDDEQLTVSNCVITACSSEARGGGIGIVGGKAIIIDTIITGCTSPGGGDGGALSNEADFDVYMKGCTISGNTVGDDGGAIYSSKKLILEDCTISGNTSTNGSGGAIRYYGIGSSITNLINNCVISNNVADDDSGALSVYRSCVDISNCVITANSSSSIGGGAIYFYDNGANKSHIWNSTISGNSATLYGGGLFVNVHDLQIYNSTFSDNETTNSYGGAIYETGGSTMLIDSSTFYNNHSRYGGALYIKDPAELRNCTISGNIADGRGGAVYIQASSTETQKFYNCTIYNNTGASSSDGGGIRLFGSYGSPELYSCIIVSNMPDSDITGTMTIMNNCLYNYRSTAPTSETNNITGDPQLGPLADNGGPTLTHALVKGSIAVDAGSNPLSLAYDQRGVGYPREDSIGKPDIGAYEYNAGAPKGTVITIR